ncbi:hypothetical protein WA158_007968 [Blastocystis sp. Blastoise]
MSQSKIYGFESEPSGNGSSATIRNIECTNGSYITKRYFDCETLFDNFHHGLSINPNGNCMGFRVVDIHGQAHEYFFLTYIQIWERVQNFASGLLYYELVPLSIDTYKFHIIGICACNSVEWGIVEQCCNSYSFTLCPLYDSLSQDSLNYILTQTQMKTCVCDSINTIKLLSNEQKQYFLKVIIVIGNITKEMKSMSQQNNIQLYTFKEIEEGGVSHLHIPIVPTPDDIHTICYTSGTTGMPKGVLISHKAFCSNGYSLLCNEIEGRKNDIYLSYLPMAHILERLVQNMILNAGGSIGYYQGSTKTILQDIQTLQPTIFVSVPRLFNRIYESVNKKMEEKGCLYNNLYKYALRTKQNRLKNGINKSFLVDMLILNPIKKAIGLNNVRFVVSGSAPLLPNIMIFLKCLFGCPVIEGYGATETCGCCLLQNIHDTHIGSVGGPTTACEIKLIDVPEMNYLTTDRTHHGNICIARGELCFRGPILFSGYYKNVDETHRVIDKDGWYHTGDIGVLLPNYSVMIIDRKKNFYKLSQGEYISAEKLESIYSQNQYIYQIYIYGNCNENYLIAIIVPDFHTLVNWYKQLYNNKNDLSFDQICQEDDTYKLIQNQLDIIFSINHLRGIERIKKFIIISEPWTTDNNLLTPSFKLKRFEIYKKYSEQINQLYKAH